MYFKKLHLSRWLQQQFDHLPPKTRKALAISCLLCSMGLWILSMLTAFHHSGQPAAVEPLKMPAHILPATRTPVGLYSFQTWLDSLKKDSTGQKIYDTIRTRKAGFTG